MQTIFYLNFNSDSTDQSIHSPEKIDHVKEDNVKSNSQAKRIVCYHTNWAQYRPGNKKFMPENIDPNLCTHIIYSFAKFTNYQLSGYEWNDESTEWSKGLYERTIDLKQKNPNLKILLAVGGKCL